MDFNVLRDSEGRIIFCQEIAFKDGEQVVDSTIVATPGGYVAHGQPSQWVLDELRQRYRVKPEQPAF